MPFQSDTRCGTFEVKLNVNVILEELENLFDKQYTEDIEDGSLFWYYVYELEVEFNNYLNSNSTKPIAFCDWFVDNYNNVYSWSSIEDDFVDED